MALVAELVAVHINKMQIQMGYLGTVNITIPKLMRKISNARKTSTPFSLHSGKYSV